MRRPAGRRTQLHTCPVAPAWAVYTKYVVCARPSLCRACKALPEFKSYGFSSLSDSDGARGLTRRRKTNASVMSWSSAMRCRLPITLLLYHGLAALSTPLIKIFSGGDRPR